MATTTNYSWTTPDNTAYVKDGASAIRTLGSSIDTSLFSITGGKNVGYQFLSAATFTSSAAVSFNNVFTTTYDAYKIIVNGIDNGNNGSLISYRFRTGGVDDTASNYQQVTLGLNGAGSAANIAETTTRCKINNFAADFGSMEILVTGPNVTANDKVVLFTSMGYDGNNLIRTGSLRYLGTSSMDGFTLFNEGATGTMTARVAVYGLRRS
jgi:hypothetical protein